MRHTPHLHKKNRGVTSPLRKFFQILAVNSLPLPKMWKKFHIRCLEATWASLCSVASHARKAPYHHDQNSTRKSDMSLRPRRLTSEADPVSIFA